MTHQGLLKDLNEGHVNHHASRPRQRARQKLFVGQRHQPGREDHGRAQARTHARGHREPECQGAVLERNAARHYLKKQTKTISLLESDARSVDGLHDGGASPWPRGRLEPLTRHPPKSFSRLGTVK